MARVERWCTVSISHPAISQITSFDLEADGAPDLGTVDVVARLSLLVARLGGSLTLTDVSPALASLLKLAGLGVEVNGQTELGKEPIGLQEGEKEAQSRNLTS